MMHKKMLGLMIISFSVGFSCTLFFPHHTAALRVIDKLMIDLLKLIIIPLTFFSIVSAILSLGETKRFKSIWLYATIYVVFCIGIALASTIALTNFFHPGTNVSSNYIFTKVPYNDIDSVTIISFIDHFIPRHLLELLGQQEMLPVVFFSSFFAMACISAGEASQPLTSLILSMRNIFNHMIKWIVCFAPIGLFSLLGSACAQAFHSQSILHSVSSVILFIFVYFLNLMIYFLLQLMVLKFILKQSPLAFLSNISTVLISVFSSENLLACLPITLSSAKQANISDEVANFVIPYVAIINLTGFIMYEGGATLFFCQVMGRDLSLYSQLDILITTIITGLGITGIPESRAITTPIILRSAHVPTAAAAALIPFENLLYRFRYVVRVFNDLVCAAVVDQMTRHHTEIKSAALTPPESLHTLPHPVNSISRQRG